MGQQQFRPVQGGAPTEVLGVPRAAGSAEVPWTVLGELGLALGVVGAADQILTWFPMAMGNPEWEFGTVTSSLDGMPVLVLGLGLLMASGVARQASWLARGVALVCAFLALGIMAAMVVFATDVPLALRAVPDPIVQRGLWRAIIKASVQGLVYPPILIWIALKGWQSAAATRPRALP